MGVGEAGSKQSVSREAGEAAASCLAAAGRCCKKSSVDKMSACGSGSADGWERG